MATFGILKPGQGYWTRVMSGVGIGLITLLFVLWLWDVFGNVRIGDFQPVFAQGAATIIAIAVCGSLSYFFIGVHPRFVDFLIATEGEMKKVNWSTRKEITGMTQAVLGMVFFLALFLGAFDLIFTWFFQVIDVLESGA